MDSSKCTSFIDTPLSMEPLNSSHKAHLKEDKDEASGHPVETGLEVDLSEVYFLIMHFLSAGPCQKTIRQLWSELGEHQLLPRRYHAWYSRSGAASQNINDSGSSFPLTYEEVVDRYSYIRKDHLLKLPKQLMLIVTPLQSMNERCNLSAADVPTLLGAGPFSLLDSTDWCCVNAPFRCVGAAVLLRRSWWALLLCCCCWVLLICCTLTTAKIMDDIFASLLQQLLGNDLQEKDVEPHGSIIEVRSMLCKDSASHNENTYNYY